MTVKLNVQINKQPDYTTCGPTSLHAVYSYYGDSISLNQTIKDVNQFDEGGGTLASILGKHALKKGYKAKIISYNISVFDPTWFQSDMQTISNNIQKCINANVGGKKHLFALKQYKDFLDLGGELEFHDLSRDFLISLIDQKIPILTGLSSTWLYRDKRENPKTNEYDEIKGKPAGHFVIVDGYTDKKEFSICDPYHRNPFNASNHYLIEGDRLITSILLGISSYDGNLLLIEK